MAQFSHRSPQTRILESAGAADGRRLLALPGIVAVVGALVTAAVSFAILVGVDADHAERDDDAGADRHQRRLRLCS